VKDNLYITPMPVDLQELRDRIVNAVALIDVTFLNKLWDELELSRGCLPHNQGQNYLNTCKQT
jgi:hypothetical protein